jgi:hypothetical protein
MLNTVTTDNNCVLKIPPAASKNKVNPNPGNSQRIMFTKKICLEAKQCIAKAMLEPELNA